MTVPPVALRRQPGRHWARRRQLATMVAMLVLLLALVGGYGLPGQRRRSAPDAVANSHDIAAVLGLLGQHAAALTGRDAKSWAADLDPSEAASGYARRQRQVFANLAQVPLTVWRYVLVAPVTDPMVLGPAAGRFDGRVVIVHVELQYAFAAVDPAPTAKQLWLTAVHRGDGWKLAADDDAATVGGPSWRGPWDFGPLLARRGPHTLVLAHPAHRAVEQAFADLVERLVPLVTSVWGPRWNNHVAVLIPDTPQEFAAVTGDASDSHDLAAVAIADQVNGDGTVLGARIVLNPGNLSRLDTEGRQLVIGHELAHLAARAKTVDAMPTWLIEGFADYVGNLGSRLPASSTASELATEVRAGTLPAALPTGAQFDGSSARLAQVYEESWLACRLIAARAGQNGLVRFYQQVAMAARTDPATAAATGLGEVLHTDVAAFTKAWQRYLVSELR